VSPIESPVLMCLVDNAQYPVTVEAIHQVFSPYGFVRKIAIFERNDAWQVGEAGWVAGCANAIGGCGCAPITGGGVGWG
jgi:hypothetical protein